MEESTIDLHCKEDNLVVDDDIHNDVHEEEGETLFPFALSTFATKNNDMQSTHTFGVSSEAAASAVYTSCSESVGDNGSYLMQSSNPAVSRLEMNRTPQETQHDEISATPTRTIPQITAQENDSLASSLYASLCGSLVDPLSSSDSLDFSQLMARAENPLLGRTHASQSLYMPTLVEEEEDEHGTRTIVASQTLDQQWYDTLNTWKHTASCRNNHLQQNGEGVTMKYSDGIEATRTTPNAIEVRVFLKNSTSNDVLDVIGNPELLRLWCQPISALIVTSASDGAAAKHPPEQDRNRMYDGEWIEATTNMLASPSGNSHLMDCIHTLGNAFWSSLGFPSYGKLTLFVERQRGQVGMTLGAFPGGWTCYHTLMVKEEENMVTVTNQVELKRGVVNESDNTPYCSCNLLEPLQWFRGNGSNDHLEQTVASMRKLRDLLEQGGEEGAYVIAPAGYDDSTTAAAAAPLLS